MVLNEKKKIWKKEEEEKLAKEKERKEKELREKLIKLGKVNLEPIQEVLGKGVKDEMKAAKRLSLLKRQ